MDKIDTLRLILFLDCNMHCSYCCNEQKEFNSKFVKKKFEEIDYNKYKNVCLSGGEPFLYKNMLYFFLTYLNKNDVYLYTNGTLIDDNDITQLKEFKNLKGINIGIHHINQLRKINPLVLELPVRFAVRDINVKEFTLKYPDILNETNIKPWVMNDCHMSNEEWVLLDEK